MSVTLPDTNYTLPELAINIFGIPAFGTYDSISKTFNFSPTLSAEIGTHYINIELVRSYTIDLIPYTHKTTY